MTSRGTGFEAGRLGFRRTSGRRIPARLAGLAGVVVAAIAFTACSASGPVPPAGDREVPPAGAAFDYQLGGAYPPRSGVEVVARDRTAAPAGVGYDICYVNGFQTQPDASADWLAGHPELLVHVDGAPLADPGWPDEYLLDASTDANRTAIVGIVGPWIEGCARDGYDAVEIDNLDSFTRSAGTFDLEAATALATEYVRVAHDAGLAIGQKNAAEHTGRMRAAGFDFAIAESCIVYDECAAYTQVYDVVLDIEYTDELGATEFTQACARSGLATSTILRDPLLLPAGAAGFTYARCP